MEPISKQAILAEVNAILQEAARPHAIAELTAHLVTTADDAPAWSMLAELHAQNNDTENARACWSHASEMLEKKGFFTKATAFILKAITLAPERIELRSRAAELYRKVGLYKDAVKQLEEIVALCEKAGDFTAVSRYIAEIEAIAPEYSRR